MVTLETHWKTSGLSRREGMVIGSGGILDLFGMKLEKM